MWKANRWLIVVCAIGAVILGQLWYNSAKISRVYYLTCLVLAVLAIVMFYLSFEGKKPKEREVVLICVLCAVAVASRLLFFMLPQFKPMGAIIIICAVCFGKEWGFLIGSMSSLVSNFFFGQGPFTPFTMLGFGILGFVAGLLFYKRKPKTWVLCLYGFFATYIIYGGIVNMSSVLLFTDNISLGYVITVFGFGFYFDLVHSTSTAIFLAILNKNISMRLKRIQDRYTI